MQTILRILFVGMLALPMSTSAQLSFSFDGINQAVPDGNPTGLVNAQEITSAPDLFVTGVTVTLNVSGTGLGGFNGDLYVTLQHEGGYSVLLNRPGTRSGSLSGYSDSGVSLTFDDTAIGDVHVYRQVLNGNHTTPIGGSLTGTWKPDARTADPSQVLDTSPRTATLSSFLDAPVNGTWTLFVTDVSSGATHQLDSWGLQITAVPEPAKATLLAGVALLALAFLRPFFKKAMDRFSEA